MFQRSIVCQAYNLITNKYNQLKGCRLIYYYPKKMEAQIFCLISESKRHLYSFTHTQEFEKNKFQAEY